MPNHQPGTVKVGLISNEFFDESLGRMGGFGQAARRVAETFNGDPSLGVEVIFLSGQHRSSRHGLETLAHSTRLLPSQFENPLYYARLRKERFDLLMTIDYRINYQAIFWTFPRTPILIWVRDPRTAKDVAHVRSLKIPHADDACPQGIKPINCQTLGPFVTVSRRLGRRVALATAAPYLWNNISDTYCVEDDQCAFLPTVVDINARSHVKTERPSVAYLGRLDPIKRPWLFVELARQFPEVDFLMIGKSNFSGPGSWYPGDLPANVKLLGHLEDPYKTQYLSSSWLLVNTSVHESLSNSFLEGLVCEAPLVSCLDPGGIVSRFGRFAGRFDGDGLEGIPKLAEALRQLIDDSRLRNRLGKEGRSFVEKTYNRQNFLESFDLICKDLLVRS